MGGDVTQKNVVFHSTEKSVNYRDIFDFRIK